MAAPTDADLLLTDETFAEKFLGFTGKDILKAAAMFDRVSWDSYWIGIRNTIETSDQLNPVDGDTQEMLDRKAKLKARAFEIFLKFQGESADVRDKSLGSSDVVKQSQVFTGELEKIAEEVRSNEVVRVAQTLMGPENLDPVDIRISEVHTINRLGTIRSDTDAAIKLPRSITQVTLDLVFAGPNQINHVFRPMLATLMASPITTIESPLLTAALINHYSTPEIEQEIRRRALLRAGNTGLLDEFDKFTEQVSSSLEQLRDIIENNDLVLEYYRQLTLSKQDRAGRVAAAVTVTEEQKLPDIGVPIPVVFQDVVVSTDPSAPNVLHVRLNFLRYNSKAFGFYGLEYRDANGNRTSDIMQCKPLMDYARWAFLTRGTTDRATFLEEYKAHTFGDTPDFRCFWTDLIDPTLQRSLETENFVVDSVQLSFGMKIVPLPLIGSKYPAVHVMGRGNIQARVVIQTTDEGAVRKFAVMKDHLDAISRNESGAFRDEQIRVENSVLNLVGATKFLIQSCDISPMEDSSNGYVIELTLAQAEYNYKAQEALILEDQTIPPDAIREAWQKIWELYQEWRQHPNETVGSLTAASPEAKLAGLFLFGQADRVHYGQILSWSRALITPSILVAAASRLFNGKNYASEESAAETYQMLFLPDGVKDANTQNTDSKRAGEKLLDNSVVKASGSFGASRDEVNGVFGTTLRRRMIGQDPGADEYVYATAPAGGDISGLPDLSNPNYIAGPWPSIRRFLTEFDGKNQFGQRSGAGRQDVGISKKLFDQIVEVLLDPRSSPRALLEVKEKGTRFDNGKTFYVSEDLERGYMELQWLFTSGEIQRFGVDISKYKKKPTESRRVLNTDVTEEQRRRLVSNYPDLPLPTYQDMFPAVRTGPFGAVTFERMVTDTSDPSKPSVPVWTRFAPTYSDVGVTPPFTFGLTIREGMSKIIRKKTDTMEPGFWFHHERLRESMMRRAEAALKVPGQRISEVGRSPLKVNINTERLQNLPESDARATLSEMITELLRENRELEDQVKEGKKKGQYFDIISSEGCAVGVYMPANRTAGNKEYKVKVYKQGRKKLGNAGIVSTQTFDRKDDSHSRALLGRVLRGVPDATFSMLRAYPAFRIYFVEWDDNVGRDKVERLAMTGRVVKLIDDLYTANSVVSFTITDSKDDSAVAEIEILNTMGTFDTDSFLSDSERELVGVEGQDDDDREGFLTRMRLQTGTGIVIQAGYSSDVNGLKTVFTGQIAEIQPGKVIKFIAQSYKVELDQEVEVSIENGNPREAVGALLRIGTTKKNMVPHLGRVFDSRDLTQSQLEAIFGDTQLSRTGTFGLQGPGGFFSRSFGYTINNVERNVWMESNIGPDGAVSQVFRNITEGFTDEPDLEYHFYNQTAWQGLQEMTRHVAGSICAVRPYDHEATCFFGYPDQPYQYRTPKGTEVYDWELNTRPTRVEAILGVEKDILLRFWASPFGTTNKLLHDAHMKQAIAVGQKDDTGKEIAVGAFSVYLGGSRLGAGQATLDAISPSYTAFVAWSRTIKRHDGGVGEADDHQVLRRAGYNRIPIYESLGLDFTADWGAIEGYNQQLARFLFAYFFQLNYTGGPWSGSLEYWWRELTRRGMASLLDGSDLNENWKQFRTALSGPDEDVEFEDQVFPQKFGSLRDRFADNPELAVSYAEDALTRLVELGIITPEEKARRLEALRRNAQEVGLIDDLLRNIDSNGTFEGRPNPAFRRAVDSDNSFSEVMLGSWPYFRLFIHYFANWLRADLAATDSALRATDTLKDLESLDDTQLPPWFKTFRDYHPVFADHDIIDNSIVATTSEMHNTVLIRGPKEALSAPDDSLRETEARTASGERVFTEAEEWRSWPSNEGVPFHPKLKRSSRKLGVAVEPNCNSLQRTTQCLMTNMALGLRNMYRGEIKIVGRVVFPWDIVLIHDSYNSMYGVIEVDRVTHEFNAETGWVTTIVPHAYCHANNPWGLWQLSQVSQPLGWLGFALDALFLVSTVWFGAGLLVNLGKVALTAGLRSATAYATRYGITAVAAKEGTFQAIKATVAAQATAAVSRGVLASAVSGGARASGKWLARNFLSVGVRLGKHLGWFSLASSILNPTVDFVYNQTIKNKIQNTLIPVDLRPLSYKGFPLHAGLDLMDEHVIPFGEKAEGVWSDIMKGIGDFFEGASESKLPGGIIPRDPITGG